MPRLTHRHLFLGLVAGWLGATAALGIVIRHDRDDARGHGDLAPPQAVRRTRAVVALVVVADDGEDFPGKIDVLEQAHWIREVVLAVLQAIPPLMTPLIIVGGIVGGLFTPTEASAIAVMYSLVLGALIYKSVGPKEIPRVLYDSARFAAIASSTSR